MAKGEETRQFIIEKAAPIFNTKGIEATSMSDIMEATKLSKGSMYVHFENKEVLACAAVDHNIKLLTNRIQNALSKSKTAKGQLFAYIDLFSDALEPPVIGGCPILNFGTEADDTNPIVKEKVHKAICSGQVLLSGIIENGINKGEFKTDLKPTEFATVIFAMLEGGHLMSRMSGNNGRMEVVAKTLKNLIDQNSI
ncbi:TetR/AcrR family transcriptional regulator [Flavobacterium sp. UBA7680]|uniref:TetR/AcrR family transcriptional regulator n=1 Tax=Flavobacterium sp. UBA7680 TaxID=1946559 RepID=UPI0025C2EA4C|nr:TetR/AcrR family transcriptional regulator [Flavobacterium sp. UBA7680]